MISNRGTEVWQIRRDIERKKAKIVELRTRDRFEVCIEALKPIAVLRMFILRVQRSKFGGKNRNSTKSRKIKEKKKEYGTICKQRGYFFIYVFFVLITFC